MPLKNLDVEKDTEIQNLVMTSDKVRREQYTLNCAWQMLVLLWHILWHLLFFSCTHNVEARD